MCGRVESGIITWAACGVCPIASVWVCEQQEICTIRSIAINMRMKMRDEYSLESVRWAYGGVRRPIRTLLSTGLSTPRQHTLDNYEDVRRLLNY